MQQFLLFSLHTRCKQVMKNFRFFIFIFLNGFQPYLLVVQANDFFFSDGLNKFTHDFVERLLLFRATVFWLHTSLRREIFWNNGAVNHIPA